MVFITHLGYYDDFKKLWLLWCIKVYKRCYDGVYRSGLDVMLVFIGQML